MLLEEYMLLGVLVKKIQNKSIILWGNYLRYLSDNYLNSIILTSCIIEHFLDNTNNSHISQKSCRSRLVVYCFLIGINVIMF